jgi:hypothetical protein
MLTRYSPCHLGLALVGGMVHHFAERETLEVSRVAQDSALLCLVYFLFDGSAAILVGG